MAKPLPLHLLPLTNTTVNEFYEYLFAPWVKDLGLCELSVGKGHASARLPQNCKKFGQESSFRNVCCGSKADIAKHPRRRAIYTHSLTNALQIRSIFASAITLLHCAIS